MFAHIFPPSSISIKGGYRFELSMMLSFESLLFEQLLMEYMEYSTRILSYQRLLLKFIDVQLYYLDHNHLDLKNLYSNYHLNNII